MKVGDLVRRNSVNEGFVAFMNRWSPAHRAPRVGVGIILSLQPGGSNPVHPCATVFYPRAGKTWDIAVSLIELVN